MTKFYTRFISYASNENIQERPKEAVLLSYPHMSDEGYDMEFVKEAFDTNWIASLNMYFLHIPRDFI